MKFGLGKCKNPNCKYLRGCPIMLPSGASGLVGAAGAAPPCALGPASVPGAPPRPFSGAAVWSGRPVPLSS